MTRSDLDGRAVIGRSGNGPTAVVMTTDDGEHEAIFATRRQAELFLSYIPVMALLTEEFAAVRSAILSPLEHRTTAATPVDN